MIPSSISIASVNVTLVAQPASSRAIAFAFNMPMYFVSITTESTSFCKLTSSSSGSFTRASADRLLFFAASLTSFAFPCEMLYFFARATSSELSDSET